MVVCNDPGSVPENWRPLSEEDSLEAGGPSTLSNHVASETSASAWSASEGLERRQQKGYCSRCQNGKPPRCHHCSVCM